MWRQPPEGPTAHPTAPGITTSCRRGPRGRGQAPGQPGQTSPTSLVDGCRTLGEKDGTKPSWVSREAGIPPPQASSRAPGSCCPRVTGPPLSPSEVEAAQEGSTHRRVGGEGRVKEAPSHRPWDGGMETSWPAGPGGSPLSLLSTS